MLATHALEQRCHLGIIAMVTGHGNAVAARSRHIGGRPAYRARQRGVALLHAAPRYIDDCPRRTQRQRHTPADATAGPCHHTYQSLVHAVPLFHEAA